jgi:hypothetical protein
MTHTLKSIGLMTLLCLLASTSIGVQTPETPDAHLARTDVERIPIGATVKMRTHDGEQFKAVLFSADESGIRVKPVTRVPEPSRRIAFDQIERIERDQDHVSVGKYAAVGSAIGAAVMLLLLAGV